MSERFTKHYTREEARALLPALTQWLEKLAALSERLEVLDKRLNRSIGFGDDLGGSNVNESVRLIADMREIWAEFKSREILIKDVQRGLLDFPAFVGGKEVFLCWEKGETDIEFWHDLESGYSGRERIQ